jgi:hypothetical protein
MGGRRVPAVIAVSAVLWLGTVGTSIALVARYKGTPGEAAERAPESWPSDSIVPRTPARSTLVMLAHPRCSCTRASVAELGELMQRAAGLLEANVLVIQPPGVDPGWTETDVIRSAGAIPGVRLIRDTDGEEARRFGAKTSGQTLVYDPAGRLVFSGGLTPARGHAGNGMGRDRIAALVLSSNTPASAPVFGCPLNDPEPGRTTW